jgi:hypothetical protein
VPFVYKKLESTAYMEPYTTAMIRSTNQSKSMASAPSSSTENVIKMIKWSGHHMGMQQAGYGKS